MKYETGWFNKFMMAGLSEEDQTYDGMIKCFNDHILELVKMKKDGVVLDPDSDFTEGLIFFSTDNEELAKKYDMTDMSEFDDECLMHPDCCEYGD